MADTRCKHGEQRNAAELDEKQSERSSRTIYDKSGSERQSKDVADSTSERLQGRHINPTIKEKISAVNKSTTESNNGESDEYRQSNFIKRMGRTTDGLSKGLDRHWGDGWEDGTPRVAAGQKNRANRLKGLGNAVVPQIPAVLGRAILEVHNG